MIFKAGLLSHLKYTFLHFKQHYIHFHIPFYSQFFQKTTNNLSQTTLSNNSLQERSKIHTITIELH